MKKIHVVVIVLLVVISIVILGIIIYKNVIQKTELPWDEPTGDEDFDDEITQDVSESFWASRYIEFLTQREIMSEDEAGNFNPTSIVIMREFLISLFKSCEMRLDYENLSDEMIVSILIENKLINDVNEINLEFEVTKKQVAFLLSAADLKIRNRNQDLGQYRFEDISELDEVSQSLIMHSVSNKYIDYVGKNFYPEKTVTRAEMSKILYMFINS